MPHIVKYEYNGHAIPSVNAVTGMLPAQGLDRWRRRVGFAEADRVGGEAKRAGTRLAKVMEKYRLGGTVKPGALESTCVRNWSEWYDGSGVKVVSVEPHIVNTIDEYHGSPDVVFVDRFGDSVLGDDKLKKRFCDWRLIMNEAAYAMCDMIDRDGKLEPVPWKHPIKGVLMFTYDPQTGEMFWRHYDRDVLTLAYQDFLELRRVYDINARSEKYFRDNATLLPSQKRENGPITPRSVTAHPIGLVSDTSETASEGIGD